MCKIIEDYANEKAERAAKQAAERAAKQAAERKGIDIANIMLKVGKLPLEEIALYSTLPIEKVRELAAAQ